MSRWEWRHPRCTSRSQKWEDSPTVERKVDSPLQTRFSVPLTWNCPFGPVGQNVGPLTNRLHLICESEKNVDQYLAPVLCADHIAWLDVVHAVGLRLEVNIVAEHC